jgi:hypothetical protein
LSSLQDFLLTGDGIIITCSRKQGRIGKYPQQNNQKNTIDDDVRRRQERMQKLD